MGREKEGGYIGVEEWEKTWREEKGRLPRKQWQPRGIRIRCVFSVAFGEPFFFPKSPGGDLSKSEIFT